MTVKLCSAERPPGSVAVTVTVAVPWLTAATVRVAPDTDTVATPSSEEVAEWERSSPSGSPKCPESSTSAVSPTWASASGIGSETSGARFGTVTLNIVRLTRPSGSVAVTVTVVIPWLTAATVREVPDAEAVATLLKDDPTSYARSSPSGSLKC